MSRGRYLVDPLLLPFTPPAFDLLTTAVQLDLVDPHWRMGIEWPVRCPVANGTYEECFSIDGTPVPPPKDATWDWAFRGATPITVYSQVDCAPVGRWEDMPEENRQALLRSEAQELERIFWTGQNVEGSGVINAFPHLADSTATVVDGDDIMQVPSVVITDIPQDIHVGIGMLEGAMRDCYAGAATLHIPSRLIEPAAWGGGLTVRNGILYTTLGSKIVAGNYPGTSPDGTEDPGVTWIYATGTVFYQREPVPHSFRPVESFDRDVNTLSMIAERTYVVGWDCCLLAIPILNGEDVTS